MAAARGKGTRRISALSAHVNIHFCVKAKQNQPALMLKNAICDGKQFVMRRG